MVLLRKAVGFLTILGFNKLTFEFLQDPFHLFANQPGIIDDQDATILNAFLNRRAVLVGVQYLQEVGNELIIRDGFY